MNTGFAAMRVGGVMGKLKRRATVKLKARRVLGLPPEDRTEEDIKSVVSLTNRSSYFWNMDKTLQRNIAKALQLEIHDPHEIILKEGAIPMPNARFYIVLTGQVAVYQHSDASRAALAEENKSGNGSRPSTASSVKKTSPSSVHGHQHRHGDFLASLGAGSHFGERALLSSEPRSATVTAHKTKVELLYLSRIDYERLLAASDRKELNEIKDSLSACITCADTGGFITSGETTDIASQITKLSYYVEWQTCAAGDAICNEGIAADRLIFFVEGEALIQCTVREPPVGKLEVANLSSIGPYSTFGASQFIRGVASNNKDIPKYKMTLRARTHCRFLSLSRVHLHRIQKVLGKLLLKSATVGVMKELFWFHRLTQYRNIPGHTESLAPIRGLPNTSQELYDAVQKAMDAAHQKDILPNLPRPHAYKVSNLAHHPWPFGSVADAQPKIIREKPLSLKASLEGMYKESCDMTWQQARRRHDKREQFSTADITASSSLADNDDESKEVLSKSFKMSKSKIKNACTEGNFQLLIKARDDAERRAKQHLKHSVTATALYNNTNELQCCSPVRKSRTVLQRISDAEMVLEAEITGLNEQLGIIRGTKNVNSGENLSEDLGEDLDDETLIESVTELTASGPLKLQPQIPHVLHDLPMLFPRRGKRPKQKINSSTKNKQTKLHDVPESFKELWPTIKVKVPHYSSASPELLSEFIASLNNGLR